MFLKNLHQIHLFLWFLNSEGDRRFKKLHWYRIKSKKAHKKYILHIRDTQSVLFLDNFRSSHMKVFATEL